MIPTGGLSVLGRVVSYTYMPAKTPQKLCWFQVREDTEKGFVWVYRYKSLEMKSSIRFHMFAVFDKSFKTNLNPFRFAKRYRFYGLLYNLPQLRR